MVCVKDGKESEYSVSELCFSREDYSSAEDIILATDTSVSISCKTVEDVIAIDADTFPDEGFLEEG